MKKIIMSISLLFIVFSLISCGGYDGPLFTGLEVTSSINETRLTSFEKMNSQTDEIKLLANDAYQTSVNTEEYLIVKMTQPDTGTVDYYEIISLVLQYPDGTERKWTSLSKEYENDPESRSWYSNNDSTRVYIPITTEDTPSTEGYTYTVSAIKYIDGEAIRDVRGAEGSSDFILMYLGYRQPGFMLNWHNSFLGRYNTNSDTLYLELYEGVFSNPDQLSINEIYINDELMFQGSFSDYNYTYTYEFSLPPSFETQFNYAYLKLSFDNGLGGFFYVEGYILENNTEYIEIFSGEQFNDLNKSLMYTTIKIMNDIILPDSFEPFTGTALVLHGASEGLTITTNREDNQILLLEKMAEDKKGTEIYLANKINFGDDYVYITNFHTDPLFHVAVFYSSQVKINFIFSGYITEFLIE